MVKNWIFFELFGPHCRNALADLDGSTPECAQVCARHIAPHLATLRKIEMVAVLCTNETTPHFLSFQLPLHLPSRGRWTPEGEGHAGRYCPYTCGIWCGCVHALLRYRSKTARRLPLTPKRGEDTPGTRVRPHVNFGMNRPAGCREIVDRTKNKQVRQ